MQKLSEENDEGHDGIKFKLRHFTKFKILLIVSTIFIVLSIIFIILYAVEKSKDHETASKPEKPQVQTYCGTKRCLHASLGKISTFPVSLVTKLNKT